MEKNPWMISILVIIFYAATGIFAALLDSYMSLKVFRVSFRLFGAFLNTGMISVRVGMQGRRDGIYPVTSKVGPVYYEIRQNIKRSSYQISFALKRRVSIPSFSL
jgi:hypothetical protein